MKIQTILALQNLIDADSNIEIIEIWERVLYIRYRRGPNKFHSKKGITTEKEGVYFNMKTSSPKQLYKSLLLKYHPDTSKSKSSGEIIKSLYKWRDIIKHNNYSSRRIQDLQDSSNKVWKENSIEYLITDQATWQEEVIDLFTIGYYNGTYYYEGEEEEFDKVKTEEFERIFSSGRTHL